MQQANATLHWGVQKNMTHSTAGLIVNKRRPCHQHSTVGGITAIRESQLLGCRHLLCFQFADSGLGCGAEYDSDKVISHKLSDMMA